MLLVFTLTISLLPAVSFAKQTAAKSHMLTSTHIHKKKLHFKKEKSYPKTLLIQKPMKLVQEHFKRESMRHQFNIKNMGNG